MRTRILAAIAAIAMALPPPLAMAQARAPKGGITINGKFYKGGQFIPSGGVTYFPAPEPVPAPTPRYVPPSARRRARLEARSSARTDYRASARGTGGDSLPAGADQDAAAMSRVQIAKNLIRMGKDAEARDWLSKVVEQHDSPKAAEEARGLLAGIDARSRPQLSSSALINAATAPARTRGKVPSPAVGANPPRYFAQIATDDMVRPGQFKGDIGVLDSLDAKKPIGTAHESGSTVDGQAAWNLTVHGAVMPGRFFVSRREFRRVD